MQDAENLRASSLHNTLIIAGAGLGIATREAVGVAGDGADDIGAMEQSLGELSGINDGDRGRVVDGRGELGRGVGWKTKRPFIRKHSLSGSNMEQVKRTKRCGEERRATLQ